MPTVAAKKDGSRAASSRALPKEPGARQSPTQTIRASPAALARAMPAARSAANVAGTARASRAASSFIGRSFAVVVPVYARRW